MKNPTEWVGIPHIYTYSTKNKSFFIKLFRISWNLTFWSKRNACAMRRRMQWPLLTLLFLILSFPVFTFLLNRLYLRFWIFHANLYWPKKMNNSKKIRWCESFKKTFFQTNILQCQQLLGCAELKGVRPLRESKKGPPLVYAIFK